MTRPQTHRALVLGFHPTARGFGWVVFEHPFSLHSSGVYTARGAKNASCLRKLGWLLRQLEPSALVLEAFDKRSSLRSQRIRTLCLDAVNLGAEAGAELAVYSRSDVEKCFGKIGAHTRHEIAAAVAQHVPALLNRLPDRRKIWDGEDRRLSVFSAAAVVLTHYQNGATAFLNDLRNAA